ncbi:unnamed protein product [Albugo candida]|uniref:Uncharacterized protein n=1 Tax=Albugo candida TaxID=65357 RepID=A0A024G4S4_9STRA|nr:unnamed protein product [Albugo candida]|eukprot:CCI41844.1 unnamed protein product [Albugo candida]
MATDRVHSFVIRNVKPRPSTNHPSYKPSSLMAVLRQKSRVRSMSQYLLTTLHQMKRMQTMEIALVYCYHNSNRFRNKLVLWPYCTDCAERLSRSTASFSYERYSKYKFLVNLELNYTFLIVSFDSSTIISRIYKVRKVTR